METEETVSLSVSEGGAITLQGGLDGSVTGIYFHTWGT